MKVGIFFGGPSREREIAFAGGRTVYDNLDKQIFEPVPIFVDSHLNFILLDWQYVYKGTIRDFYPPVDFIPSTNKDFQFYIECLGQLSEKKQEEIINSVGKKLTIQELPSVIDFAFLSLHGEFGEDGQIQGLLESIEIPYSGSGIRACSIGIDKGFQKKVMQTGGFHCPTMHLIKRDAWLNEFNSVDLDDLKEKIGNPVVIRPANQGSSIGVSIINHKKGERSIKKAIDHAFFIETIDLKNWESLSASKRKNFVTDLIDLRSGVGLPIQAKDDQNQPVHIYNPNELVSFLDKMSASLDEIRLEGDYTEQEVILESFIKGKEFSCVVIEDENGHPIALPPTEIVKGGEVFDYRSKYMAGLSRKVTPIDLPTEQIKAIRKECERLYAFLGFNVYARIDGFINDKGIIYLNDPNTTSGMLPSSFFFHQAAEIGLTPSQFLTYIIHTSLKARIKTSLKSTTYSKLLADIDAVLLEKKSTQDNRLKIGVFMGGYSFERHISIESGRNIFEKLASSDKYNPSPIFLTHKGDDHTLYQVPINLLLKDNADDIRDKIINFKVHPIIEQIKKECQAITQKFASKEVVFVPKELSYQEVKNQFEGVFIAIHGRPGEDGNVQQKLEALNVPYNGSPSQSASITIDKYKTLQTLKKNGFTVTEQHLAEKEDFFLDKEKELDKIESIFGYPVIAKPVDDGCSSAVKKINSREELSAFHEAIYREETAIPPTVQKTLGLKEKEEFPQKKNILFESLITKGNAIHFLEVTGGLLTHIDHDGEVRYEMFEPSEALASGDILSLEEKFLAGEGQNLTPARFSINNIPHNTISHKVQADLEKAAKTLGVQGYARIDAFIRIYENGEVETIIIEVNSLPGMTPATCIFHQCAINGYKPYNFIDKILEFGFNEKHRINA